MRNGRGKEERVDEGSGGIEQGKGAEKVESCLETVGVVMGIIEKAHQAGENSYPTA